MKVLVTGTAGFIGSHVTLNLLERGDEVIVPPEPTSPTAERTACECSHKTRERMAPDIRAAYRSMRGGEICELVHGQLRVADPMKQFLRQLRDQPWVLNPLVALLGLARRIGILRGERIYRHVPYRGMVRVAMTGGYSFRVISRGGQIENGLYWEGLRAHEPGSMAIWVRAASTARVVLDIGANSGLFTLAAAAAGAREVHAFEPVPRVYAILAANLAANNFPLVRAWQSAVADRPGIADMYDPGGETPTSASLSNDFSREHFGNIPSFKVPVVSVDGFCSEHRINHIDLIKLDVEGHEEFALRGMCEAVLRNRPAILMEVLGGYEDRLREVVVELFGDSYSWTRIHESDGGPDRNVLLVSEKTFPTT